jgi:fatty-acyl-CoA synthase
MTETSYCHTLNVYQDKLKSPRQAYESIGRPIPFSETKVVDSKTGQMVPLNTPGELMLRGPHIIKEYWDEKEKTRETFDSKGWLKTGDIVSMDEEGYLYFKTREKDMIIRGGANLYPAEIEAYLRTHPDVIDAQVFGVVFIKKFKMFFFAKILL